MKKAKISIGDVYVDVKPPRHEWRISQWRDDSVTLDRVDKPTVFRFLTAAELQDRNRYARKKQSDRWRMPSKGGKEENT